MIEELKRFALLAQNGSFTKTAKQVFITQSALSQSIARLEKAVDAKLFTQKGNQLLLTSDGVAVLALSERILQLWENSKNPEVRKSLKIIYNIGMFDNAALRLSKYFQTLINKDSIQVEFVIDTSGRIFEQMRLGILDLAICVFDKNISLPKNISLVKAFSEKLIPVSSKEFKLPLSDIPFVLYTKGSNTRSQTDSEFIKSGLIPKTFAESTSPSFMKELALLGSGVALLPENFVQSEIKQGLLKKQKLPIKFIREYGLFIPENSKLEKDSSIVQDIIKTLSMK